MDESALLYRFTVKCDRDTNRAIEKLAKACNLSPTAYVQRHFESITGEELAGDAADPILAPPSGFVTASEPAIVTRLTPSQAVRIKKRGPVERIMAALDDVRRADGLSSLAQPRLAQLAQTSIPTLLKYLDQMIEAGSVEIVREGQKGKPTLYRVLAIPASQSAPSKGPTRNG
ncbi:hypothetical protein EN781_00310 [Mesorhizobium sp. M4A.F.Ca.ET.090.04.2.1]|uniref:hypothetical protein n=1 Tax=Mesorhizobium sp. M4A.F.Ca.ET.090.04.2.1 TaxID=2496663 RepID=UPI000FCB8F9A|nr:hypothetical protein [Mesorhizobium sp. M4A.F.Ca.ET.090.04.2.1]RVC47613.1 hypothetical protein EN781_00310 [Mesorhizobium sp. M4A.F.Ca.ET.090.04.2.1]